MIAALSTCMLEFETAERSVGRAREQGLREPRCRRRVVLTSLYRKRISALAVQLAKDDPPLVKEVIARLRKSGDIEPDDLVYLDEIADRWIKIAEGNRQKARR
jgi:hypothetical protein